MSEAVASHHEKEVVGLIHLPVLATRGGLILLDESEQRQAGLYWSKDFHFLLKSVSGWNRGRRGHVGEGLMNEAVELFGDMVKD